MSAGHYFVSQTSKSMVFIPPKEASKMDYFDRNGATMCVACPLPSAGETVKSREEKPDRMEPALLSDVFHSRRDKDGRGAV